MAREILVCDIESCYKIIKNSKSCVHFSKSQKNIKRRKILKKIHIVPENSMNSFKSKTE